MKAILVTVTLGVVSACAPAARNSPAAGPVRSAAVRDAGIAPGTIDGDAAHRLVAAGVTVVDVRTSAEFASGHVPGAVNVPYDEISVRHGEIGPPSTPVVVYCRSGRRSGLAIAALLEKGFTHLYDLQSYDRWVAADAATRSQ
jgi:phage shock protein E